MLQIVDLLLAGGAEIANKFCSQRRRDYSTSNRTPKLVKRLRAAGASVRATKNCGSTRYNWFFCRPDGEGVWRILLPACA